MNKFKILFFGTALSIAYISCDNASNVSDQTNDPEIDGTALAIQKENPEVDGVRTDDAKADPRALTTSNQQSQKSTNVYSMSEVDVAPFFGELCAKTKDISDCNQKNIAAFVKDNIKLPEDAKDDSYYGLEHVKVVIKADGTMESVKYVTTKKESCEWCQKTAVEVVGKMTNWKPAMKNGKAVPVEITIPIRFLS